MKLKKYPLGNIYHTIINELYDSVIDKTQPTQIDEKHNIKCVFDTRARFNPYKGGLMYLSIDDDLNTYTFSLLKKDRVWEIGCRKTFSDSYGHITADVKSPLSDKIYSKMLYNIMFRLYLYLIKNKIIQPRLNNKSDAIWLENILC